MSLPVRDGRLELGTSGHHVRWWLHGDAPETLLVLHGGPGAGTAYLRPLAALASEDLQVLLWDQLGAGESDRPEDESLWAMARSVEEVEQVRTGLGLGRVHVLGQSFGGFLALEHALTHPEAVRSLVLSNTAASVPEVVRHMTALRLALGPEAFATLLRHEAAGTTGEPEYESVVTDLYARHLRRSHPWDPERSRAEYETEIAPLLADLGPAYGTMWGPNEFFATGNLLTWDVTERLGEIAVPALLVCGLHDELGVPLHAAMAERIPVNEFVVLGNSSHLPFRERDAGAYLDVVAGFVRRAARQ
jgi:proline iminopeptidase